MQTLTGILHALRGIHTHLSTQRKSRDGIKGGNGLATPVCECAIRSSASNPSRRRQNGRVCVCVSAHKQRHVCITLLVLAFSAITQCLQPSQPMDLLRNGIHVASRNRWRPFCCIISRLAEHAQQVRRVARSTQHSLFFSLFCKNCC